MNYSILNSVCWTHQLKVIKNYFKHHTVKSWTNLHSPKSYYDNFKQHNTVQHFMMDQLPTSNISYITLLFYIRFCNDIDEGFIKDEDFTMIISAWWLRTSSKFSGKNSQKSTGTLNYRKILSRCGFFQARSSQSNKKCVDRPIVSV